MIKQFLFAGILILFSICAFSQVHKKFFNKNDKPIKDSLKATSYMLYQKDGPDSLWSVVLFDMQNIPIYKGVYIDEELTIPYGKFVYYQKILEQTKIAEHQSKLNSLIEVKETGFFINGTKEGIWMGYYSNGVKKYFKTYEKNELNGLSEDYYPDGSLYTRTYYLNGFREGEAYTFWPDSSVKTQTYFTHGFLKDLTDFSENDQMYSAHPGFNFTYHIAKYLKKLGLAGAKGSIFVTFTVAADGRLINPELAMGVSPELDSAIIEAMKNSPDWVPATKKKKKVEQRMSLAFQYDPESI